MFTIWIVVLHKEACVLLGLCGVLSEPCVDNSTDDSKHGSVYSL